MVRAFPYHMRPKGKAEIYYEADYIDSRAMSCRSFSARVKVTAAGAASLSPSPFRAAVGFEFHLATEVLI